MTLASVILSNYNGKPIADVIRTSVGAVLQQTYPELELILVDDGSSDGSPLLLRELAATDPRAQFASTGRHRGIASARNVGLARAHGTYLAFLDNDAVPALDWLAILVERLEADPTIGACASRVMFHDKPDIVNSLGSVLNRLCHGMNVGMHEMDEFLAVPLELMYATGNGMIMRREAWQAAGPFDEGFRFWGHDDSDMGVRVRAAGYRIVPEPRAVVRHLHSYTKAQGGMAFWDDRNRIRFALKHYGWRDLVRFAAVDARRHLREPGRWGYLRTWLSNVGDLAPLLRYRWAHRGDLDFLERMAPYMQGPYGYVIPPDNRSYGLGYPPLGRLVIGQDDELYLYHGWYGLENLKTGERMRWGRRVASLCFSLTKQVHELELEVITPPGMKGGQLQGQVRRETPSGWAEVGEARWELASRPFARQQLRYWQVLEPGNYRLILVAEWAHREAGEFPREFGLGLLSLEAL